MAKENVQIDTKETEGNSLIRDFDFTLKTGNGVRSGFDSEKINGILLMGIISINKKANIKISFSEIPDIVIYEKKDFVGTHPLPFKITSVSRTAKAFVPSPEKWYLNNKVNILLEGQSGTIANITLRVK